MCKRVLNMFWGNCFQKFFCLVIHEGSKLRNFSEKSKKIQSSKNAQNRYQKCPNMFWRRFAAIFSNYIFSPVFHGLSSLRNFSKNSKKLKNSKNAQNRSQNCVNVFWTSFGAIVFKSSFAWWSMKGRDFEKIQKKSDHAKLVRLPTRCYVNRLNKKLLLENIKKKYFDNTVISFTKEVVSCEGHHRVQFF